MRLITLTFLALAALAALSAEPTAYPLWDGAETIEQYAKRANLEPTKTLDLGDGVKLDLVLIPAGKFIMGTPEPPSVDEEGFRSKILTGQVVLTVGGGVLLVLLGVVLFRAIRKRQRPQYSLAWFLFMTVAAGIGLMGGLHWRYSAGALTDAQCRYELAAAWYRIASDSEKPAHDVTISAPYYMGRFEVTQEQYQQVTGSNLGTANPSTLPADKVTWKSADKFCKRVSEKVGMAVRLPTEAEWEYACRAGTGTPWNSGEDGASFDRVAWFSTNSGGSSHPVGQKEPNPWGLYDMHGNLQEWCAGWYGAYGTEADVNPQETSANGVRVLRGGYRGCNPLECRSAYRNKHFPFDSYSNCGFRVVVDVRCGGVEAHQPAPPFDPK
jgi:formylglycine-generating enzyme required for sulfatase activity